MSVKENQMPSCQCPWFPDCLCATQCGARLPRTWSGQPAVSSVRAVGPTLPPSPSASLDGEFSLSPSRHSTHLISYFALQTSKYTLTSSHGEIPNLNSQRKPCPPLGAVIFSSGSVTPQHLGEGRAHMSLLPSSLQAQ